MRLIHYHFGKDGGAERFFVHLVNALARRGMEQTVVIRPERAWRGQISGQVDIIESHFRNLSLDRVTLPHRVMRLAKRQKPQALISWATRASRLMPAYEGCIKLSRLGDYPTKLDYFQNTDVLVCNTPGIGEHVRKLGWTRDIKVISNFTDIRPVAPIDRRQVDTPDDAPVIFAMGRFVPRKGFAMLLKAIARLPEAFLWLAGDGEERDNLETLAEQLGIAHRVRFLGWQTDVRPFLSASDMLVMPSSHEPLGNVILEGWAQGKPVVSSRAEGPSWFIRDGVNGILFPIDDTEALVLAIFRLLANADLKNRIAEAGKAALAEQFSEDAVVDAYLSLFETRAAGL